jgi:hypothetical protein
LGYSNLHKGFKCLDVAKGRIYISRDVVFDETMFPFQKLNPNSGTHLRAEILLLPTTSQNHGLRDEFMDNSMTDMLVNHVATNPLHHGVASKIFLSPNGASFYSGDGLNGVEQGMAVQRGSGTEHGEDSLHLPVVDPKTDSRTAPVWTSTTVREHLSVDSKKIHVQHRVGQVRAHGGGGSPRNHVVAHPNIDPTPTGMGA